MGQRTGASRAGDALAAPPIHLLAYIAFLVPAQAGFAPQALPPADISMPWLLARHHVAVVH